MTRDRLLAHLRWTALAALVAITGCSHNAVTAPSATATTTTTGPSGTFQTYSRVLSGHVLDEDGNPVPNATVIAYSGSSTACCGIPTSPVLTGNSGEYQTVVTALKPPFNYFGTDVTITALGFEDTHAFAAGTTDTAQDFRLFRPLTLTPGTDLHIRLDSNSGLCGLEGEFRCRSVHLTAPAGSTVSVETIPDTPAQPVWLIQGGISYPFSAQTRLSTSTVGVVEALVSLGAQASFVIRATVL